MCCSHILAREGFNFSSVVLLLGFEGVDGATSTTDESNAAHTLTFVGNAQIDTAQFKFGNSSCLFDAVNDSLTAPDSADWRLSARTLISHDRNMGSLFFDKR